MLALGGKLAMGIGGWIAIIVGVQGGLPDTTSWSTIDGKRLARSL
jgi:hypothetical protein